MKKILLIIIILLPVLIKAQQYVPFPDSNAVWSEYHQTGTMGTYYYYRNILNHKDTIVNSKTYHKLFYSLVDTTYNIDTTLTYNGGIREDNKRVFYLPKDSIQEYMIYDFSKNIGDTIKYDYSKFVNQNQNCSHGVDTLIIANIDSVIINNGSYRKRYSLTNVWNIPFSAYPKWIEGIGSEWGLLVPVFDLTTGGCANGLGCFKQNEDIVYFNSNTYGTFNSCFPTITGVPIYTSVKNSITISPNPVIGISIIQWNNSKEHPFSTLTITDVFGREVKSYTVSAKNDITINKTDFSPGIYFAKLFVPNGNYYITKLIIE